MNLEDVLIIIASFLAGYFAGYITGFYHMLGRIKK